jgi:hypothetical protein
MLRRTLVILGYVVGVLFVVAVTVALVAYGNDYTYDFKTGQIVQKGHVIIQSAPNGVRVAADGKQLNKKTPYQAVYSVGSHVFSVSKEGYHAWTKRLQVVAGQVSLANYVVLIPQKPKRTVIDTKPAIVAQSISKDHRHLAYITGGVSPALYSVELNEAKPTKLYTPKAATPEAPAEVLQSVAWSDDASHLLIRSVVGPQTIYRLATASGGEPINLTDQYKFDFTGLTFSAHNWQQLYWVSPDGLRRLDVEKQSVSAVLADQVLQFWPQSDRILYVQQTGLGRSLWSLDNRGRTQELIPALPESESYSVAYGNFDGHDQLAIVPSKTGTGTLYRDILGEMPSAKVLAHGVTTAHFSPDNHMVVFSSPKTIVSYDIERSVLLNADALYHFPPLEGDLSQLTWFDNYHVLQTRGDKLYITEFDGQNAALLGTVLPGLPAQRTSDFKLVVSFQAEGQVARVVTQRIRE